MNNDNYKLLDNVQLYSRGPKDVPNAFISRAFCCVNICNTIHTNDVENISIYRSWRSLQIKIEGKITTMKFIDSLQRTQVTWHYSYFVSCTYNNIVRVYFLLI